MLYGERGFERHNKKKGGELNRLGSITEAQNVFPREVLEQRRKRAARKKFGWFVTPEMEQRIFEICSECHTDLVEVRGKKSRIGMNSGRRRIACYLRKLEWDVDDIADFLHAEPDAVDLMLIGMNWGSR